jgi:hypothetical protein
MSSQNEKPIIFNSEMVRAILDDRKTQTRRIIKNPQKLEGLMLKGEASQWCPYGGVGDTIWVREGFRYAIFGLGCGGKASGIEYKSGGIKFAKKAHKYAKQPKNKDKHGHHARWRPSIHMPRWAARIFLEITGLRVERVQDISEEDTKAESVVIRNIGETWWRAFHNLWDSINAKRGYGWDKNPWVWVIEFKRVR